MGKHGRPLDDIMASSNNEDKEALYVADLAFRFAALVSDPDESHAPAGFFSISPELDEASPFDSFHWRVCARYLGPWLKRGVVELLLDGGVSLTAEMRFRLALALTVSGEKEKRNAARDVYHVIGIHALSRRGLSPEPGAISSGCQLAHDYLTARGLHTRTPSTIYKAWRNRANVLGKVIAAQDGSGVEETEALWRTYFKN